MEPKTVRCSKKKQHLASPAPGIASGISRRRFLQSGTAVAAAGVVAASRAADTNQLPVDIEIFSPKPQFGPSPIEFDQELVLLINRMTGGFSLAEYQLAESLGYEGYLAEQLDHLNLIGPNDPALEARLVNYDSLDLTAQEAYDLHPPNEDIWVRRQAETVQLMWSVYARAQLYYHLAHFWNHHLNIDVQLDAFQSYTMYPFIRDAILPNALGDVPALIDASAHGAAMMAYLNNNQNTKNNPDENYARELMELHTLGVDNGYNQTDIEELARILTGWTTCGNVNGCAGTGHEYGEFRFIQANHDTGPKQVIGYVVPSDMGILEGEGFIQYVTALPNCAEFIATKLVRYFIGGLGFAYNPPSDLVEYIKWIYLNSNPIGSIKPMVEAILQKEIFLNLRVPKYRRPYSLATAALRVVNPNMIPTSPGFLPGLRNSLDSVGMHPNHWGPPDGPYDSQAWSEGGVVQRWAFLNTLATNGFAEVPNFSVGAMLAQVDSNAPGLQAAGFNALLAGGRMTPKEVKAIQDFIGYGSASESTLKEAFALAMQLPTFQII
jgi:uncharacterized protein (DUF1800 family)